MFPLLLAPEEDTILVSVFPRHRAAKPNIPVERDTRRESKVVKAKAKKM
jgi:hypothetical protein